MTARTRTGLPHASPAQADAAGAASQVIDA